MAGTTRFDLCVQWATARHGVFVDEVLAAAKRHRLQVLCVTKKDISKTHRRLDQGKISVGVFLNTQADGSRMDAAAMLLCRAMKAHGAMVIEDPDDARIWADRATQYNYLQRAGLVVPRHYVVANWQPGARALSTREQATLGDIWMALPAVGLDPSRMVISAARNISATLARCGYRAGQKILVRKWYAPLHTKGPEARFRVWYCFGSILICTVDGRGHDFQLVEAAFLEDPAFSQLVHDVSRMAGVTGLDWFVCEFISTRLRGRTVQLVGEPPNALAGLGPGVKPPTRVPPAVARIAAQVLVDVAWRRSRGVPLPQGTSARLRLDEA